MEVAKDGLAVIVHPDNPVRDLTLEQIRGLYTAETANWNGLGGRDARVHIIAREEGSGTRSAFESLVMNGLEISPRAIVQDSNGAVRQLVAGDRYAVGFISLGLVDDTVRAVRLAGVAATGDNIINGSYSLYRPFLFVTREPPDGRVKAFIDFTLSREGQAVLRHEGLIPRVDG